MNEILIYGDIGFEVQAKDIVSQLNDANGPVSVRVDSYGGDVFSGISILNSLRRHPGHVTVYVDGIAASAASFIAVGGADTLIMSPNSSLLIHGAWSQGMGNSEELAQLSADLNQITNNLATIYAEKTGKEPDYWRELMKKDTTFSAEQAVEEGLADEVAESRRSVHADQRQAVMASRRSRFETSAVGRGVPEIAKKVDSPPEKEPSVGQKKGDAMSGIQNLAQELGVDPEALRNALSGFFNEKTTETAGDDLAHHSEDDEDEQAGDAEEAEGGELTEAEKDELARSREESEADESGAEDAEVEEEETTGGDDDLTVVVDAARLAELEADAAYGREARERAEQDDAEKIVDQAVADGKIGAAAKPRWVAQLTNQDTAEDARARLNQIRKGLVHRSETGHTHEPENSAGDQDKETSLSKAFGL